MYPLYQDVREKLGTPTWIDKHGCPRYSEPTPENIQEIYDDVIVLMEVKCQACGKTFLCANTVSWMNHCLHHNVPISAITDDRALEVLVGWGDAPWHDAFGNEAGFESQCSGTTMTTDCIVKRFWLKGSREGWVEQPIPEHLTRYEDDQEVQR